MAFETELSLSILSKTHFSIDPESIIFDDMQMMCAEIVGFGYGTTQQQGPYGVPLGDDYHIHFVDSSGDEIKFKIHRATLEGNAPRVTFETIIQESWNHFGNRIMREMLETISTGGSVKINTLTLNNEGVHIKKKPLFGKEKMLLCKWNHVRFTHEDGVLDFRSAVDSDTYFNMGTHYATNLVVLAEIFAHMKRDPQLLDILTGKKKFQK